MNYEERIRVPITKSDIKLYSKEGRLICKGYNRIVIGGRGPYVELTDENLIEEELYIPTDKTWKLRSYNVDYNEIRTKSCDIKVYFQKRTVNYADYKVGMYYITPFELYTGDGKVLITKKR